MKTNSEETMNRNLDQAIENKEVHMNCCQSVFCSQCEKFGISKSVAYHLGAFFNAGMRHGEVCGACSGALMVLGMKYGDADCCDHPASPVSTRCGSKFQSRGMPSLYRPFSCFTIMS